MVGPFARGSYSADNTTICCRYFLSLRLNVSASCVAQPRSARSSPEIAVRRAHAPGLFDGLIWPKTGCASIVRAATPSLKTFFPWAHAHSSRGKKVSRRRPPLRSGPRAGASPIAFGLSIAIEAAVVVGSKPQQEK